MSFADDLKRQKEEQKEHDGGGGNWFKFSEGDNVLRVLSRPTVFYEAFKIGICYHDCGYKGTPKGLAYIYHNGQIKLARLPYTILEDIAKFESDEDWAFEKFPMPYELNIKAENAGTKEVKYTMVPKKPKPLEQSVIDEIESPKYKPTDEIVEVMKQKTMEKHKEDGTWAKYHADQQEDIQMDDDGFNGM